MIGAERTRHINRVKKKYERYLDLLHTYDDIFPTWTKQFKDTHNTGFCFLKDDDILLRKLEKEVV